MFPVMPLWLAMLTLLIDAVAICVLFGAFVWWAYGVLDRRRTRR